MKIKLTAVTLTAIAIFGLASTLTAAELSGWKFTEIVPQAGTPGAASDAGGMSATTRDEITGSALYFVAYVERPDGSVDPAHGANPHGVFIFKTRGGRHVVRLLQIPTTEFERPLAN